MRSGFLPDTIEISFGRDTSLDITLPVMLLMIFSSTPSSGISFIFGSKLKPAGGDDSDAPPVLVARFQHLVYKLAGGGIPLLGNGPFVSVLYLITSGFQLGDTAVDTI
jgi:hypothetical protein